MPALLMGAAAGVICYFACGAVKAKFGYDDSLDAFGIHGVGGTLGAILTGVFATRACWDVDGGHKLGLIEGETRVLLGQVVAVLVTWVYTVSSTSHRTMLVRPRLSYEVLLPKTPTAMPSDLDSRTFRDSRVMSPSNKHLIQKI